MLYEVITKFLTVKYENKKEMAQFNKLVESAGKGKAKETAAAEAVEA